MIKSIFSRISILNNSINQNPSKSNGHLNTSYVTEYLKVEYSNPYVEELGHS